MAKVNWEVDRTWLAICEAFGYKPVNALDRLYLTGYTPQADTLYDAYQGSEGIFLDIEGPNGLSGRYLTEDAPMSLIFCTDVAGIVDVDTPVMQAVGVLASALRSENYYGNRPYTGQNRFGKQKPRRSPGFLAGRILILSDAYTKKGRVTDTRHMPEG